MVKKASQACNGNGGGKETFAEGGAKDISKLDEVLKEIEKEISNE